MAVDVAIIGSGHNGLVAAALLARAGLSVEVLERNPVAGGAIATEQLTLPGFRHDTFSSWHPLFHASAAYAELGEELAAHGLRYCNTDELTTAAVRRDGATVLAHRDPQATADLLDLSVADRERYLADLDELGAHMASIGELLGTELHSRRAARLAWRLARELGREQRLPFIATVFSTLRGWLSRFDGDQLADLYAPWVLHTGHPPDGAGGGFQTLATAAAIHALGTPVVAGGSAGFVDAFVALIAAHGGRVRTGVDVGEVVTRGGRAIAVRAGDEEISVRRAVIANVTPTQLYGRLLARADVPAPVRAQAQRFRFNARAGGQLHLALREPPRWRDARLAATPLVHLAEGPDGVGLACAQAAAGLLPAEPTLCCGQPCVIDPSRAPAGAAVLWIQMQELPYAPRGDAAGTIDASAGGWSPALAEAFADRVVERLSAQIENLPDAILGRSFLSPVELERRNINLQRGDIYAGDPELSQSYLWRPLPGAGSHATPVERLYQCGASTYPGAGLNAASGRIVARRVLAAARRPRRRAAKSAA